MSLVDGFSDWIIKNPAVFVSLLISAVLTIIAIWAELGRRRSERLHLVPLCALKPETDITELKDPGKREGKGKFKMIARIKIYPHGGKILYPKFNYILTFENTKAMMSGVARLIGATPVISKQEGGPWSFDVPKLSKNDIQSIEYLYLALECSDQLLRNYFTIARFKYVAGGWAWNTVFKMKKLRPWNKQEIKLFKEVPPKWVEKYSEEGELVQDWSDLLIAQTKESI